MSLGYEKYILESYAVANASRDAIEVIGLIETIEDTERSIDEINSASDSDIEQLINIAFSQEIKAYEDDLKKDTETQEKINRRS